MKKILFIFLLVALSFPQKATNAAIRSFGWRYRGHTLSIAFKLNADIYQYYHAFPKYAFTKKYAEEETGHKYLAPIADELRKMAQQHGWYGNDERDMVIAFVQQSIPYVDDPKNRKWDYPRYSIETLFEKKGDCEDKAALLGALLKTLGHDCILLKFPRHIGVGVTCTDCTGSFYENNGEKYYYVETTGTFDVGEVPSFKGNTLAVKISFRQVASSTIAVNPKGEEPAQLITTAKASLQNAEAVKLHDEEAAVTSLTPKRNAAASHRFIYKKKGGMRMGH